MTDRNIVLAILIDHFDEVGWPLHVNQQKFNDRATVVSTDDVATSVIVEIERHRPILGMAYTKGLGMDAFETYFMRYAVDVSIRSVSELTERHDSYHFDAHGIVETQLSFDHFSLSIESDENDRYLVRESVLHDEAIVSSREETLTFVLSLGEPIEEQFSESVDQELGDGDNLEAIKESLLSTYKQALDAALMIKAEQLWEEREDACN